MQVKITWHKFESTIKNTNFEMLHDVHFTLETLDITFAQKCLGQYLPFPLFWWLTKLHNNYK